MRSTWCERSVRGLRAEGWRACPAPRARCPDAGRRAGPRLEARAALCLVAGGESSVTVRGQGRGGRNQEAALAAALAIDGQPGLVISTFATDGADGPTDAAGALVTGIT